MFPGGGLAIFGFINAFVHSVMYGYYLISSLTINKTVIRVLKKPVTQLQLVSSISSYNNRNPAARLLGIELA